MFSLYFFNFLLKVHLVAYGFNLLPSFAHVQLHSISLAVFAFVNRWCRSDFDSGCRGAH
jgi:hypothetical protein